MLSRIFLASWFLFLCYPGGAVTDCSASEIQTPRLLDLAHGELERYLYLRLGEITEARAAASKIRIVVKGAKELADAGLAQEAATLSTQEFMLKTTGDGASRRWWVIGGDDLGALYGTYRLIERMGVRFYLHGDVIPDTRLTELPDVNEFGKPLFELRGVNPWGSHPFGFDAWSADDYKAIFSQLAKMRMNFLGIHCYKNEPTVWRGLAEDIGEDGKVNASHSARYATALGSWGPMGSKKTGDYHFGGDRAFADEWFAPSVMKGHYNPDARNANPPDQKAANELFNRVGEQFHDAFSFARLLGIKTAVGTEVPLEIPNEIESRIKGKGLDVNSPTTVRALYEGIFRRIAASHPVDFYWLWTDEGWGTEGGGQKRKPAEDMPKAIADIELAIAAHKAVAPPFRLALSGWGKNHCAPEVGHLAFDRALPKDIPFAALIHSMGANRLDPAFREIKDRERWSIPWCEQDGGHYGLVDLQLAVGRLRYDAMEARDAGCSGLMGLHWRTRHVAPNISALGWAAWDQSGWTPSPPLASTDDDFGKKWNRRVQSDDFYLDWAQSNFGNEHAAELAAIFIKLDGNTPKGTTGGGSPQGTLKPDPTPWEEVAKRFDIVAKLEDVLSKLPGEGAKERLNWWINSFRAQRGLAHVRCLLSSFNKLIEEKETRKALDIYREIINVYGQASDDHLATADTWGCMGSIMTLNSNSHFWDLAIVKPAQQLEEALGEPLPKELRPWREYRGIPRLIVPTKRSVLRRGEQFSLQVIVLDNAPAKKLIVHWRPLGQGQFRLLPESSVSTIGRGAVQIQFPVIDETFEYYIEAEADKGVRLSWPATAPRINQTVLVW